MQPYLKAEKRLSKEFAGTIGCEPATRLSFAAGAGAAGVSESDGFSGGRGADAAACLGSAAFGAAAVAFGAATSGRDGGSLRLASITFGLVGTGALAVVSAEPPSPTLRARLEKKPSDCAAGAADATRVAGAGTAANDAASG